MSGWIEIRGARQHNLKHIDVKIPVGKITAVTGVSGSGKSTLAFDTLYAEGQRRYIESVSSYTRQFLERMSRPEVDSIEGLRPAVAIGDSEAPRSARSTVGTATEIYDYLRLLFARIGKTHCSECRIPVLSDTLQSAVDEVKRSVKGQALIGFSIGPFRPGEFRETAESLQAAGFVRVHFDGTVLELEELKKRKTGKGREVIALVDRVRISSSNISRLTDSMATALEKGGGTAVVVTGDGDLLRFDRSFRCSRCGADYIRPTPLFFSFNSPYGACGYCRGFGNVLEFDQELIVPDPDKTILQRAIAPWAGQWWRYFSGELRKLSKSSNIRLDVPFKKLSEKQRTIILCGSSEFEGVIPFLEKLKKKSYKRSAHFLVKRCQRPVVCSQCKGNRLRNESLNVKVGGRHIAELTAMDVDGAADFFSNLKLGRQETQIAQRVLDEITYRLRFLREVGLGYITLDRLSRTLSGGELRRIEIANALGSGLVDSLYVLDEPTTGLHARDSERLVSVLRHLCRSDNTVVVVEHDRDVVRAAEWIVDLGPLAGRRGGEVVYQGNLEGLLASQDSLTGLYLSGRERVSVPERRRKTDRSPLVVKGAREHNLKELTVEIPQGIFVCVTGVSGSGKSTLVTDILYRQLALEKGRSVIKPGAHTALDGGDMVEDVRMVDQTPIGKSPRSNPVTYVKAFDSIRQVYASNVESRRRKYTAGTFSFNVPGGRCEACQGVGSTKIEMYFLADVFVTCDKCGGRRYKREILDVKHRGKSISEVLELTVEEAISHFSDQPSVCERLWILKTVGLGYLTLGQSATALSGGEAQRLKIARELLESRARGVLYILDEPTVGLHPADVGNLVEVLHKLVERGNTVLVVEHNMELIASADHCIDLGPEGGEDGGYVVASGTPEQVAKVKDSYTGKYLSRYLKNLSRAASIPRARSRR
jgi:excinuclease ABC subunit A